MDLLNSVSSVTHKTLNCQISTSYLTNWLKKTCCCWPIYLVVFYTCYKIEL